MPRGAVLQVVAGRRLQRLGDGAHHRVARRDVALRVLAQVDAAAEHAGEAEKAGVLARAVVVERARLACPTRRAHARPCRGAASACRIRARRRRGRPWRACARRRRRARGSPLCEAQATASSSSSRPRRSAAPLSTSGIACSTLTAERGNTGRSTSPSATSRLPSASTTTIAPRCADSRVSPRIASTRTGLAVRSEVMAPL